MEYYFQVDSTAIRSAIESSGPLGIDDARSILSEASDRELTFEEAARFLGAIEQPNFGAVRDAVLEAGKRIRRTAHGTEVITMAPVEVSNRCASNCHFCGWRADNHAMRRLRIGARLVSIQVEYLLKKGIRHIELVGGDDFKFVRDGLPMLIPMVKELQSRYRPGDLSFCTMALTAGQYRSLKQLGADAMIMWQETYNPEVYRRHISSGPKAWGIDDSFRILKGGDGFTFRLQSQDRAAEAGLGVSVGAILGLNDDYKFDFLATIQHARHLITRWNPATPVIVGMPTWNTITTPETCNRPSHVLKVDDLFSYFATLYFLALDKRRAWIFPNCRVPLASQVEAVESAGVFSSTEVKVGPGGYLPFAFRHIHGDDKSHYLTQLTEELHTAEFGPGEDEEVIRRLLDDMEQFHHHFHEHDRYVEAFERVGLTCS